jgi:large repetitive protein
VSDLPSPRQLQINSLSNGISTQFKIRYINSNGIGAWSSTISATPFNISSGVVGFTAVDGDHQVTLSWSIPSNLGGLPLHQYKLLESTTNTEQMLDSGDTSYIWSGLTNGVSYSFTLTPVTIDENAQMWDGVGVSLSDQIPYTIPEPPTNLTALASNQSITVSWDAPYDNGRAITGYKVQLSYQAALGTTSFTPPPYNADLSQTIYGLTNGTTYTVKVSAKNGAGYSDYSTTISAIPFAAPSEPLNFNATAGDTQITATWSASQNDGGYSITQYVIRMNSVQVQALQYSQVMHWVMDLSVKYFRIWLMVSLIL